jgi:putative hydrolase
MIALNRPLLQDMHVHSTFSDGANTLAENVAEAERLGLWEMTCVDHVRGDTDWVPSFVAAVRVLGRRTPVRLQCAVEAKLLDTEGRLDLPENLAGIDAIYAADHQVPMPDGPHAPDEIKRLMNARELDPRVVITSIVTATALALRRPEQIVIAHLFSVLPKIGLSEDDVPEPLIGALAEVAARNGAWIEISERWRCPGARTLRPFVEAGVPVLLSTDSHCAETIGRYDYCAAVADELGLSRRALALV